MLRGTAAGRLPHAFGGRHPDTHAYPFRVGLQRDSPHRERHAEVPADAPLPDKAEDGGALRKPDGVCPGFVPRIGMRCRLPASLPGKAGACYPALPKRNGQLVANAPAAVPTCR